MPNPLSKIVDTISNAYKFELPRRHLYSGGGGLGIVAGAGSITFGVLCLLCNLKGVSIPGINSIHSHLDILGSSLVGGGAIGAGGIGLFGEGLLIKKVRKQLKPQSRHIDLSVQSKETELLTTTDKKRFIELCNTLTLSWNRVDTKTVGYGDRFPATPGTYKLIADDDDEDKSNRPIISTVFFHLNSDDYFKYEEETIRGFTYISRNGRLDNLDVSENQFIQQLIKLGFKDADAEES